MLHLVGTAHTVTAVAKIYDFGALTILWSVNIPPGTTLGRLVDLAEETEQLRPQLDDWMRQGAIVASELMTPAFSAPELRDVAGRDHARDVARLALDQVGQAKRLDHFPHQLSGGEQPRVAMPAHRDGQPDSARRRTNG